MDPGTPKKNFDTALASYTANPSWLRLVILTVHAFRLKSIGASPVIFDLHGGPIQESLLARLKASRPNSND